MTIYIYRNHITDNKDEMEDLIFNMLSEQSRYPSDERVAAELDNVEEAQASSHDLFDYMRKGYIFESHCGVK